MAAQRQQKTEPTEHWCRKMRTVFRPWLVEAGSKGYITEEDLKKRVGKTTELFPELGDSVEKLYEQAHRHWVDHCNCGVEVPEGYRLTEPQYVQNMWLTIHKPEFEKQLSEASKLFWDKVADKESKGYITKEESARIGFRLTKDTDRKGVFETLDEENTGRITFEQAMKAQYFFFTDQEDENHPFTFVRGPLVD